jgi:hypothetical protein
MWLDFYKELSNRLVEKAKWEVKAHLNNWDLPKLQILFINDANTNDTSNTYKEIVYTIVNFLKMSISNLLELKTYAAESKICCAVKFNSGKVGDTIRSIPLN